MANTPILQLPEITHGEVNGDVTHNESLWKLDIHGQAIIVDRLTAQPGSPVNGQAWIVLPGATGSEWSGQDNNVAHYYNSSWHFYTPFTGWRFYNQADDLIWQWTGSAWIIYIAGDIPQPAYGEAFYVYSGVPSANQQTLSATTRVALDGFVTVGDTKNTTFTITPGSSAGGTLTFSNDTGFDGIYSFSFSTAIDFTGNGVVAFYAADVSDTLPDTLLSLIDVSNNQIDTGNCSAPGLLASLASGTTYTIEVEASVAGTVSWLALSTSIVRIDT